MSHESEKLPEPRRWRHTFKVEGAGPFPFDMLRYDTCYPTQERDARAMGAAFYGEPAAVVELQHYDASPRWAPTEARWQSFGWRVVR